MGAANPDKGRSLWSDAWKRLKNNRLAVISMAFIVLVAVAGYSAPLIAAHLTHFSPEEQHSHLKTSPPGTRAVSVEHPTYDGDKSAFSLIDLDGDGFVTCRRGAPPLSWLECPELERVDDIARNHFDYLFNDFDVARGADAPTPGVLRPDGYLTWLEFPKDDGDLDPRLRGLGLSGPDAFRALDVDGDRAIAVWEVNEQTRVLRYASVRDGKPRSFERFIEDFDTDGDLRISLSEYPGAPELHTFHFGTDGHGRDVLTRLIYGGRMSITVGLLATLVSLFIGVIYGATSGYIGGRTDNIMMRIVDVLYGLPFMFLVILLMVMFGRDMIVLFLALGAVQWLNMARVVRGQVISLKTREFVEAARAVGASTPAIIFRHLIRNAIGPVVVYATLLVPAVIMEEAFLSFLGLGIELSWGKMISEALEAFRSYPWLIVFPGAALAMTLFAMNFLGDGVRDAIDPKQT